MALGLPSWALKLFSCIFNLTANNTALYMVIYESHRLQERIYGCWANKFPPFLF